MSCTNYRIIELQNNAIGSQAVNALLPLGTVTRRISTTTGQGVPFDLTTSGTHTVNLTSKGYYKVAYSASLTVENAGQVTLTLIAGGSAVYSVTATAAAGDTVNLTMIKEVRVFANCQSCPTNCPLPIQIQLTGTAITGGTSNLIVDSCVNG